MSPTYNGRVKRELAVADEMHPSGGDIRPGANGHDEQSEGSSLVAELHAAGGILPESLRQVAFGSGAASVVVESAEGITTFGGADADPDEHTKSWIEAELKDIGSAHATVNEPLAKLRARS
jgi:hypothetical protein